MTDAWKGLAKAHHMLAKQEARIARNPEWNDHDKAVALQVVQDIRDEIVALVEKENPEAVQQLG
jgi:hypothetical protein